MPEGENPVGAYLFIPYSSTDNGSIRPVTNAVTKTPWYLCQSILINGAIYNGARLSRGQTVEVSVLVKNGGNKAAGQVITSVWWGNPSDQFLRGVTLHLIGYDKIEKLHPNQTQTGVIARFEITEDLPEHICLVAEVSNQQDHSPTQITVADRHFAQHNLTLEAVSPGDYAKVSFQIVNPLERPSSVRVQARPVEGSALEKLAEVVRIQPAEARVEEIELYSLDRVVATNEQQKIEGVEPSEVSEWVLAFRVPETVRSGEFVAIEVISFSEHDRENPKGGLAVIAVSP